MAILMFVQIRRPSVSEVTETHSGCAQPKGDSRSYKSGIAEKFVMWKYSLTILRNYPE